MRVIASTIAFVSLVAGAYGASGQEAPRLVVERGVGAEPCPDAEALTQRIEQIRGRSARDVAGTYRVSFVRKEDGFAAVINTGPSGANVRTLENVGPTCAELAKATALTLALLFDSDVPPKKNAEPVVPISPPPPPPSGPPPERPRFRRDATMSFGAMGLAGVLRPASPAVTVEAGFAGTRWRMGLGALWAIPQTLELGPGEVTEQLVTGTVRTCFAPYHGQDWLRIDVCSGAFVGLVTGDARGFSINERHTRPWVAVPFELVIAGWSAPVGWELGAGALLPVRRQDFSIDNVGIAYKSPQVAGMLSLRVVGMFPW